MLTRAPGGLWAYIAASGLAALVALLEVGGVEFKLQLGPTIIWGVLVLAVASGSRQARYALIAWQLIAVAQVALISFSADHAYSFGSILLMALVTIQLALLFSPSFRSHRTA